MDDREPNCDVADWNLPEFILSCSAENDEDGVHGPKSILV